MAAKHWMVLATDKGVYLAPHEDLPIDAALGERSADIFTADDLDDDSTSMPPVRLPLLRIDVSPLCRTEISVVAHSLVIGRYNPRHTPSSTPSHVAIKLTIASGVVAGRAFDGLHELSIEPSSSSSSSVYVTCLPACPDGEVAR